MFSNISNVYIRKNEWILCPKIISIFQTCEALTIKSHFLPFFFPILSEPNYLQHKNWKLQTNKKLITSSSINQSTLLFLNFDTLIANSLGQVDSIYFNISNAFDLIPHAFLLHGYTNLFHSSLTKQTSHVHYSGALLSPFGVLYGVLQELELEFIYIP